MKVSQVKTLVDNLKHSLKNHDSIFPNNSQKIQYRNLFSLIEGFLAEHQEFIKQAYRDTEYVTSMLSSLDYLEIILNMKVEELNEKEKPRKFLDSAWEKLEKAGVAFGNKDLDGASNKLNTCVELALKDVLDIPTTIKGINVSKIIDIMIAEKIGPTAYLEEVKNHVLHDNFVKHQGVMPPDARIVNAISATENLLKKLPKEPYTISEEVREKLWSGVRKQSNNS